MGRYSYHYVQQLFSFRYLEIKKDNIGGTMIRADWEELL